MFGQNADIGERHQIYHCLLSLNDTNINEIGYLAMGLGEEDFYQLLAIDIWKPASELLCCGIFKTLDGVDFARGPCWLVQVDRAARGSRCRSR